jgi:hypothetical protein
MKAHCRSRRDGGERGQHRVDDGDASALSCSVDEIGASAVPTMARTNQTDSVMCFRTIDSMSLATSSLIHGVLECVKTFHLMMRMGSDSESNRRPSISW